MNKFDTLQDIIIHRRSSKPDSMNGRIINNSLIDQLLTLANWAPTHGRTEPWRFIVYEKEAKKQFCAGHAELFKANTDPEKFTNAKYEKIFHQGDTASHIILVYVRRTVHHSVPVLEEIAAVAAAIQNILLGAQALGIAALWNTGGMTHHPSMKNYPNLGEEDIVMGLLYLGYTDAPPVEGKRNIPMEMKVDWRA